MSSLAPKNDGNPTSLFEAFLNLQRSPFKFFAFSLAFGSFLFYPEVFECSGFNLEGIMGMPFLYIFVVGFSLFVVAYNIFHLFKKYILKETA